MKGNFIITRKMLEQYGACRSGMDLFDKNHPDGRGEYQKLLDEAVRDGFEEHAMWLLEKVGPTDDVLEFEEVDNKELCIVFAGSIRIKKGAILKRLFAGGGIEAGWGIEAGDGISAGGGIEAGWGIEAGDGISAGWGIEAGENYGVFAGLQVKVTNKAYRTVRAKTKPENLMCGEFVEVDGE